MSDKSPKDKARKWLADEVKKKRAPPSQRDIRRKMGWDLFTELRKKPKR